jgi:lipopolysaccharide transport system ATP-binding protein
MTPTSGTSKPVVEVHGVSKRFGRRLRSSLRYGIVDTCRDLAGMAPRPELAEDEFWAVDDVSFSLPRGESLGLIGPNGAGKSTLLKMIAGLLKPDRGELTVRGRLGALIELGAGMHPLLTGRENIRVNAAVLGLTRREVDQKLDEIVDFADLGEFLDSPVQGYSSGMRVRLGFAVAVHVEPDLLLVDEVLAVGDVAFRMKCFKRVEELMVKGCSIILVSHNTIDIGRVCHRALVLSKGRAEWHDRVESGIGAYEEYAMAAQPVDSERAAAWIDDVRLVPGPGHREFQTGDDLRLDVTLVAREAVRGARLIVHVHSAAIGLLGSFSSPAAGHYWDLHAGKPVRVRLTMPRMPLLVGAYTISVALYGADRQEYLHDRQHAVRFRITGPPTDGFGFGYCHTIRFEHEWETVSGAIELSHDGEVQNPA